MLSLSISDCNSFIFFVVLDRKHLFLFFSSFFLFFFLFSVLFSFPTRVGIINRNDLTYILGSLTQRPRTKEELFNGVNLEETMEQHLDKEEEWDKFINSIVDEVMANSASDPDDQFMTIEDFMQSLATTQADFREKMNVPFRY